MILQMYCPWQTWSFLADIYAAREKNTYGISSRDILAKLKEKGTECYYFPSFEEIEKFLLKNCINGDLLITMGPEIS